MERPEKRRDPRLHPIDPHAVDRIGAFRAGETPPVVLGNALAHCLQNIEPAKIGAVLAGDMSLGYGDEHPANTVVRALFPHDRVDQSHLTDPAFRETAYALGLAREYSPNAEIGVANHG